MLRLIFLITVLLIVDLFFAPQSNGTLTRLTNTPEHAVSLNPAISDDGRIVAFESSADVVRGGESSSFHALKAELSPDGPHFVQIGNTRAISPGLSSDGKMIVFASTEDLAGRNPDRNSEIFMFDGSLLKQLTDTEPDANTLRLSDGNFQPSITADGRKIVFSSNRDFCGQNGDLTQEIFVYNTVAQSYVQLTDGTNEHVAENPKISADGSLVYYKRTTVETPEAGDLVLVDVNTMTKRVLATNVSGLSLTEGRAISNDGMRLVYSADVAPNQSQVFLFEARENSIRQLTELPARVTDVKLQPTISGDGKRVAFATRRRVAGTSDGGVELYLLDLPTGGQIQQITNAPATATAEVVSSLNFNGSVVAFNFPRILSGAVAEEDFRNNSEIYLASLAARPEFGPATVVNAASQGREPEKNTQIAPGSIATIRGNALAFRTEAAVFTEEPPFTVAGTRVTVNGQPAQIFYTSPDEVVFAVPSGLANGPAQIIVTNADGFSSRAEAALLAGAPGVFTVSGDGRGEAIALNSDTLIPAPFDPSKSPLHLCVFATGVALAKNVSVTIKGKPVTVETVASSGLKGLDEIHILVPSELSGAGASTLIVTADGVQSNSVTVRLIGVAPSPTPLPSPSPSPSPTPGASPTPSPEVSSELVISQIFGGGGNAGAPLRNDFIEIFNRGTTPVNLAGWSVQYASATASTWSVTPLTSVVLSPGQYCLIQESSGGANGIPLNAPDAIGTIAMAAASGKVALVRNTTALSGTCPNNTSIADLVGYGSTANCFSGAAPAPAASNTNALLRLANGCQDLRNNAQDFATGPPNPRNRSAPIQICAK